MRKLKYFILTLIILSSLFFLFGPEMIPENFQPQEILNTAADSDVIIIFNPGGWGNTSFEEAQDFAPIIEGIQEKLEEWGYESVVVPYIRTKDGFWGRITGLKEFFNSFENTSKDLAQEIEFLKEKLPDKKIIIAGLSSGGAFVTETYKKISEEAKGSVYTIAAGTPFWAEDVQSDNVLQLDNNGKDSLCVGEVKTLLISLLETPLRWFSFKQQAFYAPGHEYYWPSPEVNPQIITFLEDKFR